MVHWLRHRSLRATPLLSASLVAMGCAGGTVPVKTGDAAIPLTIPDLPTGQLEDPLALTAEMRTWTHDRVPVTLPPRQRVDRLLRALVGPRGILEAYDAGSQGTARQVFEEGTYNCLTFSHLFVALARELKVPAYYSLAERSEQFEREGEVVVVAGHVTAGYDHGPEKIVVDLHAGTEVDHGRTRRISDREATSLHYANRGARLVLAGEPTAALEAFSVAVTLAPTYPPGWVNLGVARRRVGDLSGAEEAYRQAIRLAPNKASAYFNLYHLLRAVGDRDAAGEVYQLLGKLDVRNPFIYLTLGDESRQSRRDTEAKRFYRRALRLDGAEATTRAALGLLAVDQGDERRARRWLQRARRADDGDGGSHLAELETRLGKD